MGKSGVRSMAIVLAMSAAACGDGVRPAPSGPTPQPITLAGSWSGTVGVSAEDGRSLGLVWSAERQGGGELSGPATLSTLPSAAVQVTFVGTMTSVREGDRFVLTYTSDPTSSNGVACTASATGTARLDQFTLVGDLDVQYRSCVGFDLQPPASTHLELLMKLN